MKNLFRNLLAEKPLKGDENVEMTPIRWFSRLLFLPPWIAHSGVSHAQEIADQARTFARRGDLSSLKPQSKSFRLVLAACAVLPLLCACTSPAADQRRSVGKTTETRVLVIETNEVTSPDVTISPDGETLVFAALGHLFRISVNGGEAEQLTFGPFYDEDPALSPDGSSIAFGSDRGAGHSNVFVLTPGDAEIRAVTDEFWAARPAWSTDSRSLLYLSHTVGSIQCGGTAGVHRIGVDGSGSQALTDRRRIITSAWLAANGTPEWVVWEEAEGKPIQSVIERAQPDGSILSVASVEGLATRASPGRDGAYFVHRVRSWLPRGELIRSEPGNERRIADITRRFCRHAQPRFAVSPDSKYIYLGEEGKLWRYSTADGSREEIPFHARIEFTAPVAARVQRVSLPARVDALEITSPSLSEGGGLLFGALAQIWWRRSPAEPAISLTTRLEIARNPVLSADGKKMAYIRAENGHQEIVSFDLSNGSSTALLSGNYFWDLEWHPDGKSLVVTQGDETTYWILSVDAATGAKEKLVAETGSFFFPPRPHYTQDARKLYYSAYEDNSVRVYAVNMDGAHSRVLVATLPFYLSNIQVSPDRKFIAFRRNSELWLAALGRMPAAISEETASLISRRGGRSFRFLGSGKLLFAEGDAVKEYDIGSDEYRDLQVGVSVEPETASPLLIENVRVLDFATAKFTTPTSILLKDGAIARMGSAADGGVPSDIARLDAGGRFAIPGLIDPHMHSEAPWWLVEVEQSDYISYGVTTVRDVGERIDWVRSLGQRSRTTSAPLPRYLYTGELFQYFVLGAESPVPYANSSILVYDEATARRSVREQAARGAHGIKAYASLPVHLFRSIADEARRIGLPVIAHGTNTKEVVHSVLAGVSFVEHLDGPSRFYGDIHGLLAKADIYWTPTLSIMGGTRTIGATADFLASKEGTFFRHLHDNEIADLTGGKKHGVRLLIGTDNPYPDRVGERHHMEMKAFSIAGYSSLEVLDLATRRAAAALGIADEVGSIEVGKQADIVLLNLDPLADIENTRTIWRVVKNGWVFDPDKLRTRPAEAL